MRLSSSCNSCAQRYTRQMLRQDPENAAAALECEASCSSHAFASSFLHSPEIEASLACLRSLCNSSIQMAMTGQQACPVLRRRCLIWICSYARLRPMHFARGAFDVFQACCSRLQYQATTALPRGGKEAPQQASIMPVVAGQQAPERFRQFS